jgi:hypothetical protein
VKSDGWTSVSIPIPDPVGLQADGLTGLLVKMNPGGEYEIQRIEIVAAKEGAK